LPCVNLPSLVLLVADRLRCAVRRRPRHPYSSPSRSRAYSSPTTTP
jgi:hypothetical protein